jgi:hypothetical protein
MVQLIQADKKLCERGIATSRKCANLGTVQENFPASHGIGFFPGPEDSFRGRPAAIRQSVGSSQVKAQCFAPPRSLCQKSRDEPYRQSTDDAGKDRTWHLQFRRRRLSIPGSRFSLLRDEGHSPVLRDLVQAHSVTAMWPTARCMCACPRRSFSTSATATAT